MANATQTKRTLNSAMNAALDSAASADAKVQSVANEAAYVILSSKDGQHFHTTIKHYAAGTEEFGKENAKDAVTEFFNRFLQKNVQYVSFEKQVSAFRDLKKDRTPEARQVRDKMVAMRQMLQRIFKATAGYLAECEKMSINPKDVAYIKTRGLVTMNDKDGMQHAYTCNQAMAAAPKRAKGRDDAASNPASKASLEDIYAALLIKLPSKDMWKQLNAKSQQTVVAIFDHISGVLPAIEDVDEIREDLREEQEARKEAAVKAKAEAGKAKAA